ncbi:MAG: hypothetical protein AABY00_02585 [Nanoarchaeota archaeon]
MFVKVLGSIDLISATVFLMLTFSMTVPAQYLLFCAGLLFCKSLFILGGDLLSVVDLFSSLFLIVSLFFALPTICLWTSAFLLIAKGVASFL